jgi:3-carboxy-cis,cis-muconate cycloisomerase
VYRAASSAFENKKTLKESLLEDTEITTVLSEEEIDRLIDPINYTGSSEDMIKRVLKKVK